MTIVRLTIGFCLCILFSSTTNKQVSGIYQANKDAGQLVLRTDSTFEWIYTGSKAIEIGTTSSSRNLLYYTEGKWTVNRGHLTLAASPVNNDRGFNAGFAEDSISRFTSISCLNFWNRFGDQVKIRAIQLPGSRPKPHFGNTLYFFAQDFSKADTLIFFLEGYIPFLYPGTIAGSIGDNIHKITLYEPYHEPDQTVIKIRGKRLYAEGGFYVRKK